MDMIYMALFKYRADETLFHMSGNVDDLRMKLYM